MHPILRIVVMVLGVVFTLQGVGWLINPAASAEGLGMPLLDGVARSTQVGDFAMFFLAAGATILLGSRPGQGPILYFPAALIGGAAVTRTLAWAFHGAAFAALFIVVELVTGVLLVMAARSD